MDIKNLLTRILHQELLAAAYMAYFAGIAKTPALKTHFLDYAYEELKHFSTVVTIISEMSIRTNLEPIQINLEQDELKTLILLDAVEDTLIHYYEDILSSGNRIGEPMRSRLRSFLEDEKKHKEEFARLLKEVKAYHGGSSL